MNCNLKYTSWLILAILLFSCKESYITEEDLISGNQGLNLSIIDTTPIETSTVLDIPQNAKNLSELALGSIQTADFGKIQAGFYTNFRLNANNINLGTGAALYKIDLLLDYKTKYGPFTQPMDIIVYELNEPLKGIVDSTKSNKAFGTYSTEIGRLSGFIPNTSDSVVRPYEGKLKAHLSIPLSNDFGNKILSKSGLDELKNNDNFQNYIKGIYVTVNSASTGDGMLTFSLASALTRLTIYYKNDAKDSLKFTMALNNTVDCVNNYFTNTSGSTAQQFISNPKPGGDSIIFLQGLYSVRGKIMLKGIENLKNIAINKAELIIPTYSTDTLNYPSPTLLYCARIDNDGSPKILRDFNPYSQSSMDGALYYKIEGGRTVRYYKINLTRYVQSVINGEFDNNGLYLYNFPFSIAPHHAILCGGNHSSTPMKLKLTITKTN